MSAIHKGLPPASVIWKGVFLFQVPLPECPSVVRLVGGLLVNHRQHSGFVFMRKEVNEIGETLTGQGPEREV